MVHKRLEGHVIGEDSLGGCGAHSSIRAGSMRCGGVQLREKETSLGTASVTHDESWERESIRNEILLDGQKNWYKSEMVMYTYTSIFFRLFEQSSEALVALLLLITSLPPFGSVLAVENENMEECVQ